MIKIYKSEIWDRPEILICYSTLFFIRFYSSLSTSFYITWVSSFYEHSSDGQKQAIASANEILFWSNLSICPLLIIAGVAGDKVKSIYMYPIFIWLLAIGWFMIYFADHPYSALGFIGQITLIWATSLQTLQNLSLLLKLCGTKIKGPIIGIGVFWGSIGFSIAGKLLGYLSSIDTANPFLFWGWLGWTYLVFTTALTLMGLFKS